MTPFSVQVSQSIRRQDTGGGAAPHRTETIREAASGEGKGGEEQYGGCRGCQDTGRRQKGIVRGKMPQLKCAADPSSVWGAGRVKFH